VSRDTSAGLTVGAVLLGVLALGALIVVSLAGTRTETSVSTVTVDPEDMEPGDALITSKSESGGTSIFGLHFGQTTYVARVWLITAPGCSDLVESGDPWPAPFDRCSSPVAITGEVAGEGVASTGESLIEVAIEVNAQCYAAVVGGEPWPPEGADCAVIE
jgi:hypothetical protein